MANPLYLSRFRVVANTLAVSGTVDTVAFGPFYVAAGTYYLDSSVAAESFMSALDDAITPGGGGETFTCAFSLTTGLVTITCTSLGGTWSLTFNQLLADIIGWGSTLGFGLVAGAAQVSPEVASHCIFAGSGRQQWAGPASEIPNAHGKSSAGVTSGVGSQNESFSGQWLHGFERFTAQASPLESGTKDDAGTVRPWTWADFFKHHRTFRHPFRLYASAGDALADYEDEFVLRGKSLGPFAPSNVEEGSWYFWQVPLEVDRYLAP